MHWRLLSSCFVPQRREAESEARASAASSKVKRRKSASYILKSLPIVWLVLSMVPVLFLMIPFSLRWNVVMKMVNHHCSRTVFVALQSVRILAVGSLIKWKMGLFPDVFAWGTAFPRHAIWSVCFISRSFKTTKSVSAETMIL
jgi:hypothetical protein